MMDSHWSGLLLVIAAGAAQGSFMLPMKWTRAWAWENTWLVFACTAYLLCPWTLVLSTIPGVFTIYASVSPAKLATVVLFGACWGVGAITFGLGVSAVGMALGFPIILGLSACLGALFPLLSAPAGSMTGARILVLGLSAAALLIGVATCSYAGKWKDQAPVEGVPARYGKGVLLCVLSGVLSACANIGFVLGEEIVAAARRQGVPAYLAPNVVWALLTVALFLLNSGYAILLLRRNRTASRFQSAGSGWCFALGASMGVLWLLGFFFYGAGVKNLGDLGSSFGWGIMMSVVVLVANLLGLATGEWTGAPAASRRQLGYGIATLLLAIAGLAISNGMS